MLRASHCFCIHINMSLHIKGSNAWGIFQKCIYYNSLIYINEILQVHSQYHKIKRNKSQPSCIQFSVVHNLIILLIIIIYDNVTPFIIYIELSLKSRQSLSMPSRYYACSAHLIYIISIARFHWMNNHL